MTYHFSFSFPLLPKFLVEYSNFQFHVIFHQFMFVIILVAIFVSIVIFIFVFMSFSFPFFVPVFHVNFSLRFAALCVRFARGVTAACSTGSS